MTVSLSELITQHNSTVKNVNHEIDNKNIFSSIELSSIEINNEITLILYFNKNYNKSLEEYFEENSIKKVDFTDMYNLKEQEYLFNQVKKSTTLSSNKINNIIYNTQIRYSQKMGKYQINFKLPKDEII